MPKIEEFSCGWRGCFTIDGEDFEVYKITDESKPETADLEAAGRVIRSQMILWRADETPFDESEAEVFRGGDRFTIEQGEAFKMAPGKSNSDPIFICTFKPEDE
jgi:hypothetical protein